VKPVTPGVRLRIRVPEQNHIETAAKQLDQIRFPELPRPAVGQNSPPTNELVTWAIQMYCFSLLSHFREMLRSFLTLIQSGLLPADFVIARCMFEMAAHAHYTNKHMSQYLEAGELKSAWDFLIEINMGSRYMHEEYGDQPADWPPFAAPREIAKVIRCFDEWAGKATTEYSFLSEFAHPNMAAFSHYYAMEAKPEGYGTVKFIDPPREVSTAPWHHVSISLVASLHFVLRLLQRIGEKQVAPQIEVILTNIANATELPHPNNS
jgi:hypothetical protein